MSDDVVSMIDIAGYTSAARANETAATLVGQGIGAEVVETASLWLVRVVAVDAPRARALLGLAEPTSGAEVDEAKGKATGTRRRSWGVIAAVAAAYVLIPLAAFLLTVMLTNR